MEQNEYKLSRTDYSQEQRLDFLARFKTAHTSVKEFCRRHGINESSFRKWQSRYGNNTETQVKAAGFAQLQISSAPVNTPTKLFAEVKGIKIYQPVAASYLKDLL